MTPLSRFQMLNWPRVFAVCVRSIYDVALQICGMTSRAQRERRT